jgi:hypothetical protein
VGCAVLPGDQLAEFQFTADAGQTLQNDPGNIAANLFVQVDNDSRCPTVQANGVPGEFSFRVKSQVGAALLTAVNIRCTGDLDINTGDLRMGPLHTVALDVARNAFLNNATVANLNVTGNVVFSTPLFEPDAGIGVPGAGYLPLEGSSTNLLLQSVDFNTTWTKTDVSVASSGVVDPFGGTGAQTITDTNPSNIGFLRQVINIPADSSSYTSYVFHNTAGSTGTSTTLRMRMQTGGATINYTLFWNPTTGIVNSSSCTSSGSAPAAE